MKRADAAVELATRDIVVRLGEGLDAPKATAPRPPQRCSGKTAAARRLSLLKRTCRRSATRCLVTSVSSTIARMPWLHFLRLLAVVVCTAMFSAHGATFLRLQSQPGDLYSWGGQQFEYREGDGGSYAIQADAGTLVFYRYLPCTACVEDLWEPEVHFAAPTGQTLGVGRYQSVQRFPGSPTSPGLLYVRASAWARCK